MAKLGDLKTLLAQRAATTPARPAAAKPVHPASHGATGSHSRTPPQGAPLPVATSAAAARRAIAATKHAEGDLDLERAFADVTRLPPPNRATAHRPRPTPVARQRLADERDALEMSKYGREPAPHSWDIGQELEGEQTFLRRGLGTDVLTGLRRGRWVVQAVIDLHGMTTDEAHDALADFLDDARGRGLRCVRVIHGKGLTSPNREPVLKGKVRRWLAHWDDVLAYCEAPAHAGGGGAVVVLLSGKARG